jgi:integrase
MVPDAVPLVTATVVLAELGPPTPPTETIFARAARKAGLPDGLSLHSLRHSTGTYLTAAGVSDRVVMEILGHSSTRMTLRYQHMLPAMLADAGQRLEAFFAASGG